MFPPVDVDGGGTAADVDEFEDDDAFGSWLYGAWLFSDEDDDDDSFG